MCRSCFYKFKNKTVLIRLSKGNDIEILDDSYEGKYICKDGHIVKSKSEREIDNYLYDHDIKHAYEKAVPIDSNPDNDIHPDFYLPQIDVFIEHWGYEDNEQYNRSKEYKLKEYRKQGLTLICTSEKIDSKDIETRLKFKLATYEKDKINFLD